MESRQIKVAWAMSEDNVINPDDVSMAKTHPWLGEKEQNQATTPYKAAMDDFLEGFDTSHNKYDKLLQKECQGENSDSSNTNAVLL